jgi:hypothetical protein
MSLENQRAQGRPGGWPHPWPASNKKSWRQSPQVSQSTGLPCAMVLRLIRDLPGDRAFLPPSLRRRHQRNLASASGGQDHTTSPSVSTSLVLRHRYVHRIPRSTFVTTRPPLQMSTGRRDTIIFSRKTEVKYFSRGRLTLEAGLHRLANIGFFAHGILASETGEVSAEAAKIAQPTACRANHEGRECEAAELIFDVGIDL